MYAGEKFGTAHGIGWRMEGGQHQVGRLVSIGMHLQGQSGIYSFIQFQRKRVGFDL